MNLTDLLREDLIRLELSGSGKEEIMQEMIAMLDAAGTLSDSRSFAQAVFEREKLGSTGVGFGVAIPHGKSNGVKIPSVAFGRKKSGVDWDSLDGEPAQMIFLIAVPETNEGNDHLKILQLLSRKLIDETFRNSLLIATTKQDVLDLMKTVQ